MGRRLRGPVLAGALILSAACGANGHFGPMAPDPAPASDLPERFEPFTAAQRIQPGDTLLGSGCLSPMVDPRTEAGYLLVRSAQGQGDYRVAAGEYGAGEDQLLRLECNTGRPLGLVSR